MKPSDLNHLRRLLGWIRCDIGQAPAELQQTMIDVADGLGHPEISEEAKARMVETYRRAEAVPLYVRAAVKALEKTLAAAGREPGAEKARPTAETRANLGLDPGAGAGRELAVNVEPVLTDDEMRAGDWWLWMARRYTPAVADRILRDHERAVLAKVRSPIAGERAVNPHIGNPYLADAWQHGFLNERRQFRAGPRRQAYKDGQAARAALASAPVAEPETMEEILRRERERMPLRLPRDPTLPPSAKEGEAC